MTSDRARYTRVAIALHWAIAALIIFNICSGLIMEGLQPPGKIRVILLHFSSGITVLALTVVRIAWRLMHRPPPLDSRLTAWERTAAHAVHASLYVIMLAMPLTGWLLISATPLQPQGPPIWGLFPLPVFSDLSLMEPAARQSVHDTFVDIHSTIGWLTIGLLVLHIAAALKHQFYDRHAQLARMGIGSGDS